jgi:hypothetical protein
MFSQCTYRCWYTSFICDFDIKRGHKSEVILTTFAILKAIAIVNIYYASTANAPLSACSPLWRCVKHQDTWGPPFFTRDPSMHNGRLTRRAINPRGPPCHHDYCEDDSPKGPADSTVPGGQGLGLTFSSSLTPAALVFSEGGVGRHGLCPQSSRSHRPDWARASCSLAVAPRHPEPLSQSHRMPFPCHPEVPTELSSECHLRHT